MVSMEEITHRHEPEKTRTKSQISGFCVNDSELPWQSLMALTVVVRNPDGDIGIQKYSFGKADAVLI